jgi:hypothetical protein
MLRSNAASGVTKAGLITDLSVAARLGVREIGRAAPATSCACG